MSVLLYVDTQAKRQAVEVSADAKVKDVVAQCGGQGVLLFQGTELAPDANLADTGLSNEVVVELVSQTTITFAWTQRSGRCVDGLTGMVEEEGELLESLKLEMGGRRLHCPGNSWHGGYETLSDKQLLPGCRVRWFIMFARNEERGRYEPWAGTGVRIILADTTEFQSELMTLTLPASGASRYPGLVHIMPEGELGRRGRVVVEHELNLTQEHVELRARAVGSEDWVKKEFNGRVRSAVPFISLAHRTHGTVLEGPTMPDE
eukprot:Hpha_TRINITY_DN19286_c0_g1::TRINITY_DN19286_c0_g1_i1::g.194257::m.194257